MANVALTPGRLITRDFPGLGRMVTMLALIVPEDVLADLRTILSGAAASVREEPVREDLENRGFIGVFICKSDQAAMARVTCQRAPPYGVLLTVEAPWQAIWRRRAAGRLMKRIKTVLLHAGATTLSEAKNRQTEGEK